MNQMTTIYLDPEFDAFQRTMTPTDHEGQPMYDARTLHAWLGVKTPFQLWLARRIGDYSFEVDIDFHTKMYKNGGRGRPRRNVLLTRDMAKELALVENNEMGRKTRRYFIAMEAAAVEMAATLTDLGKADAIPQSFFDARSEMAAMEERLTALIQAALPAPTATKGIPAWPEFVTARAVADHMEALHPRLDPRSQAQVVAGIGMESMAHCLLHGHEVLRVGAKGKPDRNSYARAGVLEWLKTQQ